LPSFPPEKPFSGKATEERKEIVKGKKRSSPFLLRTEKEKKRLNVQTPFQASDRPPDHLSSRAIKAMSFGGGELPLVDRFALGGLAGMTASAVTHPLDTLKVQLQLQTKSAVEGAKPRSSGQMLQHLVKTEGVARGLYPGYVAVVVVVALAFF
jgi:Mitochondrial carrier protein